MRSMGCSALALLMVFCACEPGAIGENEAASEDANLLVRVQLGVGHHVDFRALGKGVTLIDETAPNGVPMVLGADTRGPLAGIYRRLQPAGEVPQVLLDFDRANPREAARSSVEKRGNLDQWQRDLGGCSCPHGTKQVHKVCKETTTGNFDDHAESEWAWFNISTEAGNGLDAFVTVEGVGRQKYRYAAVETHRMVGEGPKILGGLDIEDVDMRIEIKGAEGDRYHFGACWEID